MSERRNLGEILLGFGRISEEEIEGALAYQRENGGYFGEALLALGFVTPDELEWGLASQFDLPHVFPDVDSIDPEAASLVPPEWALAHLALPIFMTEDTLKVVVDSPLKSDAVEELRTRTDRTIELALASPERIRELIRRFYARPPRGVFEEGRTPAKLTEVLARALDAGSARFGISTRGARAWGWWDEGGSTRRRPLEALWESELDRLLSPPPSTEVGRDDRRKHWTAELAREGILHAVEVRYLGDESGRELLFRPGRERTVLGERFDPPPREILSEVRLLARSGSAGFLVTATPPALGHEIVPHLPLLLFDPSWRSIHVTDRPRPASQGIFSVELPADAPEAWRDEIEALRPFHFDVTTLDLSGPPERWIDPALEVASVAFLRWRVDDDPRVAREAGIRWELTIAREEGEGRLGWRLAPTGG